VTLRFDVFEFGKVISQRGEIVMPKIIRRRSPFYLRRKPKPQHDIRLLRPSTLPLGERFETLTDVREYSVASELRLGLSARQEDHWLADCLNECRKSRQRCGLPSCPICARLFRIWFIGELLRIVEGVGASSVHIVTALLKEARYDRIELLDVKHYDAMLRKRLCRNDLGDAAVIGGYENVYRARKKKWMLHINLVIVGGAVEAVQQFKATFSNSDIVRPAVGQAVADQTRQLSYILKFSTYHRPFSQNGFMKSDAVPLNPREHCALVPWMAQWKFQDFMFLFNARREGVKILSGPWSRLTF
jgi:hypothetical protein